MQPKSTSKKSYPITGYPNNNDKKNILLSKEHLVIQISLVFLFWNSHRPLLPRMRIPSSIHKRPLYSRVEGGRKGKREAREERNGKREALASTVYIYIYIRSILVFQGARHRSGRDKTNGETGRRRGESWFECLRLSEQDPTSLLGHFQGSGCTGNVTKQFTSSACSLQPW